MAQAAPPSAVASGLAAPFRSPQTPSFGQMAAQLFGQSTATQTVRTLASLTTRTFTAARRTSATLTRGHFHWTLLDNIKSTAFPSLSRSNVTCCPPLSAVPIQCDPRLWSSLTCV